MTDENSNRLPRISITRGYEVWCDQHGQVAVVATQVEARAQAKAHQEAHRNGS
jgi:hypothetical protein